MAAVGAETACSTVRVQGLADSPDVCGDGSLGEAGCAASVPWELEAALSKRTGGIFVIEGLLTPHVSGECLRLRVAGSQGKGEAFPFQECPGIHQRIHFLAQIVPL